MDQEQEGQSSEPAAAETTFSQPTSKESSPERTDCSLQNTPSPIAKLMARTGYSIVQQNGQRRYGPPPDWDGPPPPRGCEIFVGKIPRDCFEDELVPVFEKVGRIYEMRLMMDFSGQNRGYAFVVYGNPLEAKDSVRVLNNYEIRKGRTLGICMSVDNCRLFVGGIPKKVCMRSHSTIVVVCPWCLQQTVFTTCIQAFPIAVTLKVGGALWQLLMQLITVRGHTNLIFLLILKCFADFQKVKRLLAANGRQFN